MELYRLFQGKDSSEAWRFFHEQSPPLTITSPETWGKYATSLYNIHGQPSLTDLQLPCPMSSTFFTTNMVKKSIYKMKTSRAYDHEGLAAEHFIHARDMLAEPLAVLFNRAMCEGFPSTWSKSIIIPILKSGDPMEH